MGSLNSKSMHFMNLLWFCSVLMAPIVYGLSPWLNTFVVLENTNKGSWLVVPSLPSSYLFGLKFHWLYLAIGISENSWSSYISMEGTAASIKQHLVSRHFYSQTVSLKYAPWENMFHFDRNHQHKLYLKWAST